MKDHLFISAEHKFEPLRMASNEHVIWRGALARSASLVQPCLSLRLASPPAGQWNGRRFLPSPPAKLRGGLLWGKGGRCGVGWRTDVFGHRRSRVHRIERGGEPQ